MLWYIAAADILDIGKAIPLGIYLFLRYKTNQLKIRVQGMLGFFIFTKSETNQEQQTKDGGCVE
jgi:hypothetical protein